MIYEFRDPVWIDTPLGLGRCLFVESTAHDQYWTVVTPTRAIVTFRQEQIRFTKGYTFGFGVTDAEMKEYTK